MSSPGPSISERGGNNSPSRSATKPKPIQLQSPIRSVVINNHQRISESVNISGPVNTFIKTTEESSLNLKKNVFPKKQLKIYKMSPSFGMSTKKVTIQMKDSLGKIQNPTGTFIVNKNNNGNFSGNLQL